MQTLAATCCQTQPYRSRKVSLYDTTGNWYSNQIVPLTDTFRKREARP